MLNLRKTSLKRRRVGMNKSVSRKFHSISEAKIMELKKVQMKKRSETKMMWAMRALNE